MIYKLYEQNFHHNKIYHMNIIYHTEIQCWLRDGLLCHIKFHAALSTANALRIRHGYVVGAAFREQHVLLQRFHRIIVHLNVNVCERILLKKK